MSRWARAVDFALSDLALPAIGLAVAVGLTTLVVARQPEHSPDALAYACGAVAALALGLRRHAPRVMVGAVAVALAVYSVRGYASGPAYLTGPVALLAFGQVRPRRETYTAAAGMLLIMAIGQVVSGDTALQGRNLTTISWTVACPLIADALRGRAERALAAQESQREVERRTVAEERMRIAQDLHDSIAHAMVTINVQSGVAAHLAAAHPEQVPAALETIRATSAAALDELGTIVGHLRQEDAPRRPPATLSEIPDLVSRSRETGLVVELTHDGEPHVTHAVEAAAYRVVQEALTNVMRHAPGTSAQVTIQAGSDGDLTVRVTDSGRERPDPSPLAPGRAGAVPARRQAPASDATGSGMGLFGMRERVETTGGRLTCGPRDEGGFMVLATWPAP